MIIEIGMEKHQKKQSQSDCGEGSQSSLPYTWRWQDTHTHTGSALPVLYKLPASLLPSSKVTSPTVLRS